MLHTDIFWEIVNMLIPAHDSYASVIKTDASVSEKYPSTIKDG